MKETEYIIGTDPYRKIENWFFELLIKFKIRKPTYIGASTFKLILDADYFNVSDTIKSDSGVKLIVIDKPTLTFWSRIKNFFNFKNLVYKYNVKIDDNENKIHNIKRNNIGGR